MHYFKAIFVILFLSLNVSSSYAQDSNVVNYSLFLEKTVSNGTYELKLNTKVNEGNFKEGKGFVIPEANLTGDFAIYQDLYNALVGGRFSIDYGALNHDIIMKIYIRNLSPTIGEYLNLGDTQDTLFSYFEIRIWELPDSNFYPEETSYYFNEGYYARFSLPKSPSLLNFLEVIGISYQDSLAFAFLENNNNGIEDWNGFGIETIDTPDSVKFKAIHLSRIGGGRKRIAAKIFSVSTDIGQNLKQNINLPQEIYLGQNYPNPFNPSTKISYSINSSGYIKLNVYNILGKHIFTIVDQNQTSGNYEVEFSSSDLPSGLYIYSLETNGLTLSKKMILMK